MKLPIFLAALSLLLSGCKFLPTGETNSGGASSHATDESNVSVIDDYFQYGEDYILAHLGPEYWITYTFSAKTNGSAEEPVEMTSAHNQNGYYLKDNQGAELLFLRDGNVYYLYTRDENGSFVQTPQVQYTESQVQSYSVSFLSFMAIYEVAKDDLVEDGEEVIAGRPCKKYVLHVSNLAAVLDLHYSIDKVSGVCLRYQTSLVSGVDTSAFEFLCITYKDSGVLLPGQV